MSVGIPPLFVSLKSSEFFSLLLYLCWFHQQHSNIACHAGRKQENDELTTKKNDSFLSLALAVSPHSRFTHGFTFLVVGGRNLNNQFSFIGSFFGELNGRMLQKLKPLRGRERIKNRFFSQPQKRDTYEKRKKFFRGQFFSYRQLTSNKSKVEKTEAKILLAGGKVKKSFSRQRKHVAFIEQRSLSPRPSTRR